jgi:hypothetical protein
VVAEQRRRRLPPTWTLPAKEIPRLHEIYFVKGTAPPSQPTVPDWILRCLSREEPWVTEDHSA